MRLLAGLLVVALGGVAGAQQAVPVAGFLLLPDKPYEGVRQYDREQKQPDGKTLKQHEVSKFFRDSAGRLRQEVTQDHRRAVWTYLTDPAAKVQYRWNNEQKVVYEYKTGDPVTPSTPSHPLASGEVREVTIRLNGERMKARVSLLPAKTVDGQETEGEHRVVYSDAERTKVFSTTDTWTLKEYHVALEQVIEDEKYGRRLFHFSSFKPVEPKADLFEVPRGWVVKKVEGPDTEQFE